LQHAQLQPLGRVESPGGVHYTFSQTWGGTPVKEAQVGVTLDHAGNIRAMTASLAAVPQGAIPDTGQVSRTALSMRYRRALQAYDVQAARFWLPAPAAWIPIWVLTTMQHDSVASYEIQVDARTGMEISRADRGIYHRHAAKKDTTGRGRVFYPDPLTRARTVYGSPFTDANDQHLGMFDTVLDTVALKNISYVNGKFRLEGPYVKMVNLDLPADSVATSLTGDFFFTREQQAFEDVMVYFYADSFQRYVQGLGFTNLQNGPFPFDAHGYGSADNSQFVPNGGSSYIRFGDGGVDDAEDADVIIHEYTHALSFGAAPNTNSGFERRGLDEGMGDYFAASYSKAIDPYNWAKVYSWDGHNEFWAGRDADIATPYSASITNFYTMGSIWSSALMRMQAALGRTITDRLMLQEMYANIANQSLADAANHLLDADTLLYGGANSPTIIGEFCACKLLTGAICTTGISPGQPEAAHFSLTVSPNPAQGELHIGLTGNNAPTYLALLHPTGRQLLAMSVNAGTTTANLALDALPAGVYILQAVSGDVSVATKVVVIR